MEEHSEAGHTLGCNHEDLNSHEISTQIDDEVHEGLKETTIEMKKKSIPNNDVSTQTMTVDIGACGRCDTFNTLSKEQSELMSKHRRLNDVYDEQSKEKQVLHDRLTEIESKIKEVDEEAKKLEKTMIPKSSKWTLK